NVGGGAAGDAAADMLRREGFEGSLTMISSDTTPPYDRPNLSKDYLAGNAPEEWLPLRSPDFYEDKGIDLLLNTIVSSIDAEQRKVITSEGKEYGYDRLLLATGASPIRLDVPGTGATHVRYLRSVADCRAIIEAAGDGPAVVVGASFIGLEAAASLRARGLDVHVVAPESVPMERVFGTGIGEMIRTEHEKNGVVFHLGQTVSGIRSDSVALSNNSEIEANLVVVGVGVRPSTSLAEEAGLSVDHGVTVDKYLQASDKGIFAAGDIARWPGGRDGSSIRIEHWVVAQRQGQVAAKNMLGAMEPFSAIPFFWTHQFDVQIGYLGHAAAWDRIDVDGSVKGHDFMCAYRRNGTTLAVAAMNRDAAMLQVEAAMERSDEQSLSELVAPSS
ncbi:MAG: FAD-dependent oxidoreductase, partial [Rhodothermia bacterium]|nr:FAD-dependent oxidoreductase [Rhodothermia bacterium]